ncbi:DUF4190 domain-containing protein [Brevibacterium sandarakinum]|uniref:DUF4190 domain-containing protein n=1 Tax=Brevibacterium sandarakinum TaxID=629680 RepID=UPI001E3894D1|nr:DUF4190 domain-containing protein [Brevibacterium sandarakinum]
MSYNPNYRPSDPPQVGSQQFNNGYGASQPTGYSQPGAYGYGQPEAYSQPGAYGYGQPGSYSQPMTYGPPTVMVRSAVNSLSGWAMWMGIIGLGGGFVCSILSLIPFIGVLFSILTMFLWIAPVLAVIFGHVSRGQINRTGEDGRGQATAGLVMGYIGIGFALLMVILFVGIMGLGFMAAGMNY